MSDKIQTVEEIVKNLLNLVGIEAEVKGSEEEEVLRISLSTQTPALLIGYHGKTLDALSVVAGAILYKKLGEHVRVVVDVDEWRVKREEKLVSLAENVAARVRASGQEEPIYDLTPAERRVVHTALSEVEGVVSESQGEGRDRYLVVKPA